MDKLHLHLISDHSGKTVRIVSESTKVRFCNVEIKEYFWPFLRTTDDLIKPFRIIKENPGIIIYTIKNSQTRSLLKEFCRKEGIICISAIGRIIKEISNYIGEDKVRGENNEQKFDDEYFDKIDAIEYTIKHDDGRNVSGYPV